MEKARVRMSQSKGNHDQTAAPAHEEEMYKAARIWFQSSDVVPTKHAAFQGDQIEGSVLTTPHMPQSRGSHTQGQTCK